MGIERGRALGMPLDQFTEQAYAQLATDKEIIIIGNLHGSTTEATHEFLEKRDGLFNAISNAMAVHFQP